MKKVFKVIGNVIFGLFIAVAVITKCKSTFTYDIRDNEVYVDRHSYYYHYKYNCPEIENDIEDRTTLGVVLDKGYKPCPLCGRSK